MNRKELKETLMYERNIYLADNLRDRIIDFLVKKERVLFYRYLLYLRKEEFYLNKKHFVYKMFRLVYTRKKNKLGNRIDIKIMPNMVKKGIDIHHKGIIINGYIGENCKFHGRNTIGNNEMGGYGHNDLPIIGDCVEFGMGSMVFGKVEIANNCKIGAGAIVIKSIDMQNSTIVGIPAKIVK